MTPTANLTGNVASVSNSDYREQQKKIRELEAEIREKHGDDVYIVSLDVPSRGIVPGRVFQVTPHVAAQRIYWGTHAMGTPAHVKAYRAHAEKMRAKIEEDEANRREREGNVTARDLARGISEMHRAAAAANPGGDRIPAAPKGGS